MAQSDQVAIQLHRALETGALPPEGRRLGHQLMAQLHHSVRIAVVGLAGAGKTSLINMLLGGEVMQGFRGVAAIELGYGDVARGQITLADGTIKMVTGVVNQSHLPPGTARVSQQLPDSRLKEWSFTEVNLSDSASGQRELLDWMTERCDLAIWCSQQFDDRERNLWTNVPDHLKDHSFLALTRADRLHMKGELTQRIARLQPIVNDEFFGLYPVATLQAIAALKASATTNDPLWQSSGGSALVDGIRQQIEKAKSAALDHAYVLLQRYKATSSPIDDQPETPAPQPRLAANTRAKGIAEAVASSSPTRKSDSTNVINVALDVLRDCADELLASPDGVSGDAADRILDRCSWTAGELVKLLSDSTDPSPHLEALREGAVEGEQMVMLLRLERGENAAEDSLTVLLQLKKDLAQWVAD
ncbi:MAG: hypothetical protein ABI832_08760 [bacterium]